MKRIYILIPPSEGKMAGGINPSGNNMSPEVQVMMKKLQLYKGDWAKLLGIKDKALAKAIKTNQSIISSARMPAIERYSGVVYNAIDYPSLDKEAKAFFDQHVRIVSAVFGLVKPLDLIPDYKLKIEKLGADKYWQPINSRILKDSFVLDLLPQAHKKAVSYTVGQSIDFIVRKNGKAVSAGHQGKQIKGRFIRWMCQNQCVDSELFNGFDEDGFQWDGRNFIKESILASR